jgi:hypothetical protein
MLQGSHAIYFTMFSLMVNITKIKWLKVFNDFDNADERKMDDYNYHLLPYSLCYFLVFVTSMCVVFCTQKFKIYFHLNYMLVR